MKTITANDLKSRGISVLESALEHQDEAIISVCGRPRYVLMDIAHYEKFREAELHSAWKEAHRSIAEGDVLETTAEEHIARLQMELSENAL